VGASNSGEFSGALAKGKVGLHENSEWCGMASVVIPSAQAQHVLGH
jgi:hypothetical protein